MLALKRVTGLCMVMMMTCGMTYAQFSYSVNFSKNDIVFKKDRGYDVVEMKGCKNKADFQPGNPSLPAKSICLVIPQNTRSYSITIDAITTEPVEGEFEIIPQQPPIPIGASLVQFVEPNAETYSRDSFFPRENAGISYSGAYHGTSLVWISVFPIRYNPVQKKLELITHIDFTLNLQPHEFSLKKCATQKWVNDNSESLRRLVDNLQDVGRFMYVPEIIDNVEYTDRAAAEEYLTVSPNPANPITTIVYSIRNPSDVKLTIYSIVGQKVATLVDGPMSAGKHSVNFDGSRLASGVYLYRFESAGLNKTGKMLLLK